MFVLVKLIKRSSHFWPIQPLWLKSQSQVTDVLLFCGDSGTRRGLCNYREGCTQHVGGTISGESLLAKNHTAWSNIFFWDWFIDDHGDKKNLVGLHIFLKCISGIEMVHGHIFWVLKPSSLRPPERPWNFAERDDGSWIAWVPEVFQPKPEMFVLDSIPFCSNMVTGCYWMLLVMSPEHHDGTNDVHCNELRIVKLVVTQHLKFQSPIRRGGSESQNADIHRFR